MIPTGIKLDHEYHIVELHNYKLPFEALTWLKENCGEGNDARWIYKHPKIYFLNQRDHLMFTLRWA